MPNTGNTDQLLRAIGNQAGRIDQVTQSAACGSGCPANVFAYDNLGRLSNQQTWSGCYFGTSVDSLSGTTYSCSSLVSSNNFTYDATGNRTDNGGVPTTGNRYQVFNVQGITTMPMAT